MAVIIVGDIDVNKTEATGQRIFQRLKNPANEKKRFYADVPARAKDESIVVTDKEATNFFVEVDYPFYKVNPDVTLADYRHDFIKSLFTSMLNQRLSELVKSDNPPFLYASTGFGSYARGYESFGGFAVAGKSGPDTALNILMQEIERVKKYGFTRAGT